MDICLFIKDRLMIAKIESRSVFCSITQKEYGMKITGLITEYNPFHNGHLYHIEKAKEVTGADAVLVVMSGDFVQRGEPAIFSKEIRVHAALSSGASAVFELPVVYATGSGEIFAAGAVSLLNALGCVDSICFGTECGNVEVLSSIADLLLEEPEIYRQSLQRNLRQGKSFPIAREEALIEVLGDEKILREILQNPNNILGIEYLKALKKLNSSMKPYTIRREGASYHENSLGWKFDSATSIRQVFRQKEEVHGEAHLQQMKASVPEDAFEIYKEYLQEYAPATWQDYSLLLKYRLMEECSYINSDSSGLTKYLDVSENLSNRIGNHLEAYVDPESFARLLKTKELNYTRISRSLLHILLSIKTKDLQEYMENGNIFYGRLLGFRKKDAEVLSCIKKNSCIPMISKLADAKDVLKRFYEEKEDSSGKIYLAIKMLRQDIFASELYDSARNFKEGMPGNSELRKQIRIF